MDATGADAMARRARKKEMKTGICANGKSSDPSGCALFFTNS